MGLRHRGCRRTLGATTVIRALLLLWLALCLPITAHAGEFRAGIFVGNNSGGSGDLPLVFAVSDAEKMRDLFVEVGDLRPTEAILLEDAPRRAVENAFESLRGRLEQASQNGIQTTLFFYYSGHGDDEALRLGTTLIPHEELREWLENSGANVRVAMLDACHSGSAIRTKGGTRGRSFDFGLEVEQTRGTAILTSSAASELSQESSEVGGGFFTHYLHTALLGAADSDHNGEVSLTEANTYVHAETAFSTRDTPDAQTPSFDFDIVGSGTFSITTLESANAQLSFQGGLDGVYAVWDDSRKRYVAEVRGAEPLVLAVRPGTYYVHRRMPGWVDEARYQVRKGETLAIYSEDFVSVPYEKTASRGPLQRQVRKAAAPTLALRAAFGARTFGDRSVAGRQYVPTHGIAGVQARFLKSGKSWYGFDILNGGGGGVLNFEELGEEPVTVASTSLGATIGYATAPKLFRAGIGAKAEGIGIRRSFQRTDTAAQSSLSLGVGPTVFLGVHYGRLSLDLETAWLIMATKWDEASKRPVYAEPILALGYRF